MQVMWPSTSLCDLEPGNVISEETFQLKFDRPPNYAKLALTILNGNRFLIGKCLNVT